MGQTLPAVGTPVEPSVRRPIGQPVRVAEFGERFYGTRGTICEHVPGFGVALYRVAATRVREYGIETKRNGWSCLFFNDQLRTQAK